MIALKIPLRHQQGGVRRLAGAVSENWSDRKWKGERSSQSPDIPAKRVPRGSGGQRWEVPGWRAQLCAMRSVQRTPQRDPQSHHFHQELPITHLGLILSSSKVSQQNRGPPSLLFVCHLLNSSQPQRFLLIGAMIDNAKCRTHPDIPHQITPQEKPCFSNWRRGFKEAI